MEFWRLGFFFWFLISCSAPNKRIHLFEGHTAVKSEVFDTLNLVIDTHGKRSEFRICGSSFINQDSFEIVEESASLVLKTSSCGERSTLIKFVDEYVNENECRSIYPFFLESITLLDLKEVLVSNISYQVLKLSNESYGSSSTIYWLRGFGIVMIGLEGPKYYVLREANDTDHYWEGVLTEILADVDFSETWPIPPLPPPPRE